MILATPEGLGFRVNLPALPSAPRLARRFLAKSMELWGIEGETADDALLLVSEVTTNAALATGRMDGPAEPSSDETVCSIIVRAWHTGNGLRVEVWDNSPAAPVLADPDESAEGGRGLRLVEELADEWGCEPEVIAPGGTAGKTVWFRLTTAASATPAAKTLCTSAAEPPAAEPDPVASADFPGSAPLKPALPCDPPGQPVALPRRTPSPSRARERLVSGGQAWWMEGRPDLRTMAQLHAALVSFNTRSLQPTGTHHA